MQTWSKGHSLQYDSSTNIWVCFTYLDPKYYKLSNNSPQKNLAQCCQICSKRSYVEEQPAQQPYC